MYVYAQTSQDWHVPSASLKPKPCAKRKRFGRNLARHRTQASLTQELLSDYTTQPRDLPEDLEAVWYQSGNHRSSGLSPEETEMLQEDHHVFRSAFAEQLKEWIRMLAMPTTEGVRLKIPPPAIDTILITINDFRLKRAAEYSISEKMMENHLAEIPHPDQRIACLEIHVLGDMIAHLVAILE